MDKPAYATTGKGLGVFSFACSTDEIKFNGCTNVTGQWLNRRRVPNSGTQLKYSLKGLVLIISMILAFMGTANAVTFKYDVHVDKGTANAVTFKYDVHVDNPRCASASTT
ncbi:hypothetical protein BC829DRAFT_421470 [Chytridium lagenaria]|nr:hypothetical protein BC829DRAFT_421470 [Chytridium lagenaria]